ncbi:MAG: DUF2628 domain-containing protein [Candidatus Fimivivens sp.]
MCGSPLANTDNASFNTANTHSQQNNNAQHHRAPSASGLNWDINGISSQELSAYTGSRSYYFLQQFKSMLHRQSNMSWNWGALIFNFLYFFYRKMYKVGFALLGFYIFSIIPAFLCYLGPTDQTLSMMGVTLGYNSNMLSKLAPLIMVLNTTNLFLKIWCALNANKLYLKNTLQNIRKFKNESGMAQGTAEYYNALYYLGKPNYLAVVLLILGYFIASGILARFITWSVV